MIMECIIVINRLCKHIKKGQKQPTSHSCTKLSKTQQFFSVSNTFVMCDGNPSPPTVSFRALMKSSESKA